MQIIKAPIDLKAAAENENRDANLASVQARIDFLCLLDGVPVETDSKEEMAHE